MNLAQRIALLEKQHYPFRNYPKTACSTLLFPGCSFPAQFPNTMAVLSALCQAHEVGVAYDCCGKPLAELSRTKDATRIGQGINRRFARLGVQEIVCLCPNCMEYLLHVQEIPVVSVYELLARWNLTAEKAAPCGAVFLPCPDRHTGGMLAEISTILSTEGLRQLEGVPCCGLRGDIAAHGPAAGDKLCAKVKERAGEETIYTYCASCSGQFQRHGCGQVRHLLSVMLGVDEAPDATHAFFNRIHTKFI